MLSGLAVAIHVLIVFWLVSGIVGRDRMWAEARRTEDLERLKWLVEMAGQFDARAVRPGTFAVLVAGLIAAWARGWPILGFLQGGPVNWVLASLLLYLGIIPVIAFVFIPRGNAFRRVWLDALAKGAVTPELRAALRDPVVSAARGYELLMIAVLTYLMVTRPF